MTTAILVFDSGLGGLTVFREVAKARPDADCFQCHLKHASKDNVWVQFYPTLRDPE